MQNHVTYLGHSELSCDIISGSWTHQLRSFHDNNINIVKGP